MPVDRWRPFARRVGTMAAVVGVSAVAHGAPRPDPTDPAAPVPPLRYESTLKSRPADGKPVPWREANDAVARIGGWRQYAREPLPGAAAVSAPAPPPFVADPHRGHRAP